MLLVVSLCFVFAAATAFDLEKGVLRIRPAWQRMTARTFGDGERSETRGVPSPLNGVCNVVDYGARGDNVTDDAPAIQRTLNTPGCTTVFVPAGMFRCSSRLVVPEGVTFQGSYSSVGPGAGVNTAAVFNEGSSLLPTKALSGIDVTFIELTQGSSLSGFMIYYVDQLPDSVQPDVYGPTVGAYSCGSVSMTNMEIVNPYIMFNHTIGFTHYINRVIGQPLYMGIYVDGQLDIGRIENVHFNPGFFTPRIGTSALFAWQLANARAFTFGRSDWEYVFNTFAFGYNVGYHFIQTPQGAMNGNLLGIGADLCARASVLIDALQPMGLLITNGEFTAFQNSSGTVPMGGATPTHVVVNAGAIGRVSFVNSAFWGKAWWNVLVDAPMATVSLSSCTFSQWYGPESILIRRGILQLSSSSFQMQTTAYNASHVTLGSASTTAMVWGNSVAGVPSFRNPFNGKLEAMLNTGGAPGIFPAEKVPGWSPSPAPSRSMRRVE